jgi:hypothetical protein
MRSNSSATKPTAQHSETASVSDGEPSVHDLACNHLYAVKVAVLGPVTMRSQPFKL